MYLQTDSTSSLSRPPFMLYGGWVWGLHHQTAWSWLVVPKHGQHHGMSWGPELNEHLENNLQTNIHLSLLLDQRRNETSDPSPAPLPCPLSYLWMRGDTMAMTTYRRKSLVGKFIVSEGKSMPITAQGMTAGRQEWCWSSRWELICWDNNHNRETIEWYVLFTPKVILIKTAELPYWSYCLHHPTSQIKWFLP